MKGKAFSKDQKHRKMSFITLFPFISKLFKFQSHNGIKIHSADAFRPKMNKFFRRLCL